MIRIVYLFLLSTVISSAVESEDSIEPTKPNEQAQSNSFDKIVGTGVIQGHLLDFLQLKEKVNFISTCTEYSNFLNFGYEKFVKDAGIFESSYKDAPIDLKTEIRKLFMYYELETDFRRRKDNFTLPKFYQIISRTFFTNPAILFKIEDDNFSELNSIFDYSSPNIQDWYIPHFPNISLILLKSGTESHEIEALIKNACNFPYVFDKFFKHLAENIYKVKRDKLPFKIKTSIKDFNYPVDLSVYQTFLQCAFAYFGRETFVLCLIIIITAYQFVPFEIAFDKQLKIWFIIVMGLNKMIEFIYRKKYENFTEYDLEAIRRYMKSIDFIYFKSKRN